MTSAAVDVSEVEPAIVRVTMQDRAHKNMFTLELIMGLMGAFEAIAANTDYKVVILTGYENYFATGGTREGLLGLYEGKGRFTDANFYSLPLDCPIPVIAAMQGHAIGGGFVLGLFADFVLLSRESVYCANFMKYGFTPGMGATYIVPKKLGLSLGEELLLNGENYRGADLEKRGVPFPVYTRTAVPGQALQLAQQIAEKPRLSLTTLKAHLVAPLREELPGIIAKEIAMHEKTFHQPEVKQRIMTLFGQ
ncbi:MAG TPA: polyketide synthase [Alphaproteobacteria bacterium]|nr:polyketide synthase [Alphaproteobacteria bacterium]